MQLMRWTVTLLLGFLSTYATLFTLDRLLYYAAPSLPYEIWSKLSYSACYRVSLLCEESPFFYSENIRFCKTHPLIDFFKTDTLGYRNPRNYLSEHESSADIVLLGDSFTWGTEDTTIADHLRTSLAPLTVYSLGMGGEGIPQWRYHYLRFMGYAKRAPGVVVLNYYSGNDISDTNKFLDIKRRNGFVDSRIVFNGEGPNDRSYNMLKLPELTSLIEKLKPSLPVPLTIEGLPGRYEIDLAEREMSSEALTDDISEQIKSTVDIIRRTNPACVILLAYIPTGSFLYGGKIRECPQCSSDIQNQAALSVKLGALRAQATDKMIWIKAHFNPEGYRLYADILARSIREARKK